MTSALSCIRCDRPLTSPTAVCDCDETVVDLGGRQVSCLHCDGRGSVPSRSLKGFFTNATVLRWSPCETCEGRGWLPDDEEAEALIGPFRAFAPDDER